MVTLDDLIEASRQAERSGDPCRAPRRPDPVRHHAVARGGRCGRDSGSRPRMRRQRGTARRAWTSRARSSGAAKARLLDIIVATCHDPLLTVNISPAALVRSIGADPPTTAARRGRHRVRARRSVTKPRGSARHPQRRARATGPISGGTSVPGPPSTALRSRWPHSPGSAPCPTRSQTGRSWWRCAARAPSRPIPRPPRRAPLKELGTRLGVWIRGPRRVARTPNRTCPSEDRAADTWEPLIAVADLADGDWPARARKAAIVLTAEDEHRHHPRRPAAGRLARRIRRR